MPPKPPSPETLFQHAASLASQHQLAEAATGFQQVADLHPKHDLADDALYNVGACYLALNQHARAADVFRSVIERYPDARIAEAHVARGETGRTAARAWLGLVSARLGQGDPSGARAACEALAGYPESRIHPAPGIERTFHDVARSLLLSSGATTDDCDHV